MREIGVIGKKLSSADAKRYLAVGRKYLGILKNQMRLNGQKQGKFTKRLADGTKIVCSSFFGQDFVKIEAIGYPNLVGYYPGFICIPVADEVQAGWGLPFFESNEPLGTENGEYPETILLSGDFNEHQEVFRADRVTISHPTGIAYGNVTWISTEARYILSFNSSNGARYFTNPTGNSIYRDGNQLCSGPPSEGYTTSLFGAGIVESNSGVYLYGVFSDTTGDSIGGSGYSHDVLIYRRVLRKSYSNDSVYDPYINPDGWEYVERIQPPTLIPLDFSVYDDALLPWGMVHFSPDGTKFIVNYVAASSFTIFMAGYIVVTINEKSVTIASYPNSQNSGTARTWNLGSSTHTGVPDPNAPGHSYTEQWTSQYEGGAKIITPGSIVLAADFHKSGQIIEMQAVIAGTLVGSGHLKSERSKIMTWNPYTDDSGEYTWVLTGFADIISSSPNTLNKIKFEGAGFNSEFTLLEYSKTFDYHVRYRGWSADLSSETYDCFGEWHDITWDTNTVSTKSTLLGLDIRTATALYSQIDVKLHFYGAFTDIIYQAQCPLESDPGSFNQVWDKEYSVQLMHLGKTRKLNSNVYSGAVYGDDGTNLPYGENKYATPWESYDNGTDKISSLYNNISPTLYAQYLDWTLQTDRFQNILLSVEIAWIPENTFNDFYHEDEDPDALWVNYLNGETVETFYAVSDYTNPRFLDIGLK